MNQRLVIRPYGLTLIMGIVMLIDLYAQEWDKALLAFSAACGWALADHYKNAKHGDPT